MTDRISTKSDPQFDSRVSSIASHSFLNFNGSRSQRLKRSIRGLRRSNSEDSSLLKVHHRFRFWLNKKNQEHDIETDSSSTVVGTEEPNLISKNSNLSDYKESIVYKGPERDRHHHLRKWLNDDKESESSSEFDILEIRQSIITTRIVKARRYARSAAEEAARIASLRCHSKMMAFIGAVTTASFARLREAQRNPNASHGSIANDTMVSLQEVSNAIDQFGGSEADYIKLNEVFKSHFQYKGTANYFKRLKPLRIQELDPNSGAYKMYYKMKAIPNPPMGVDPLEYYLNRDAFTPKQQWRMSKSTLDLSEVQSTKSVQTRVSTAKSIFWSLIGMEAESTRVMGDYNDDLQEIHADSSEKQDRDSIGSSKSIFWSFTNGQI